MKFEITYQNATKKTIEVPAEILNRFLQEQAAAQAAAAAAAAVQQTGPVTGATYKP